MKALLEARGISKSFPGISALSRVSFRLERASVHALMGENGAGKSTLVKCLMGMQNFDSGELLIEGEPVRFVHPRQAIQAGISMIEQELTPVEELTVAENILLGREPVKRGFVLDYRAVNARAADVMALLGLDIKVTTRMKYLSLAEIQLVEIAKALSYESKIIIMDEPTSAIGEKEVETLFGIIRKLRDRGTGIIYVSHRMEEIFAVTDRITILRDGHYIDTVATAHASRGEIVEKMVGRKMEDEYVKTNTPRDEIVLSVNGMSRDGRVNNVSLELRAGEILGIFGLMGSGRSEFCNLLFGVEKKDSGSVMIRGNPVSIRSPKAAVREGMAYVTEDRKNSGLYLEGSAAHNISLTILKTLSRFGFLKLRREKREVMNMVNQMRIKIAGLNQIAASLSGGNQQKVVLSKWLIQEPSILILDEPTRGIDVGAKREIYEFMSEFASSGKSVILISSEIPEILGMSDRIVVFKDGQKRIELGRNKADQNALMHFASANEESEEEG